ncbi:succinylglutamate desuccinylase [Stutzerimonas urumqiensis]|uniref:succinylglutamate desuccinylase n=1 Tax=Stutzerimonas urumqiensis TaxID=638269 RepID=UPI003DA4F6EB
MLALGKWLELTLAGREPMEKIQLTAKGVKLHWLAEGAMLITPPARQDTGADVVLSAGVHGNEVVPILLLDRLIRRIARGELIPGVRVLCLLGNPGAVRKGVRALETDLNRLFLGAHADAGGDEAFRAAELERLVETFYADAARTRRHYDLHSPMRASRHAQFAVRPAQDAAVSDEALARLADTAIEGLVLQERPTRTFSAHTATQFAADSVTLELTDAPSLGRVEAGLARVIAGQAPEAGTRPKLYRVVQEILRRSEGFYLRLPADIENFAPVARGSLLAEEAGGGRQIVEEEGAHILFPMAQVAIGQRAGLILVECESQPA